MSSSDPFELVGHVLDGQFRVDQLVGEGSFSAVYRGHHLGLDEPVALKCLKLSPAIGEEVTQSLMRRFRDESKLLYRLSQGNLDIVRSIANGTATSPATGRAVPYMVLEWLEGRSLAAELIVRKTNGAQGRPMHEAMQLLDSAADALAYAHNQGVVHRDLNPGNIFLAQTRTGPRTKVLDFGVAKVIKEEVLALGPRAQTLQSIRIFSPAYAAPEQFDERIGHVSCATDVWSLAVILMEVMTDRPVFDGEALGDFFQKVLDPSYPRTLRARGIAAGEQTERVLKRATAMSPLARQPDAGTFWAEMRAAVSKDAGSQTIVAPTSPFHRAPPPAEPSLTMPAHELLQGLARVTKSEPPPRTARVGSSLGYDATLKPNEIEAARAQHEDAMRAERREALGSTVRLASSPVPVAQPQPAQPAWNAGPPPAPPVPAGLFQAPAVAPPPGTNFAATASNAAPVPLPPPLPPPADTPQAPAHSGVVPIVFLAIVVVIVLATAAAIVLNRRGAAHESDPSAPESSAR